LPGNHRELEPPDPIPNSVVKWFIADGSVGFPHVRVGHCQASKLKTPSVLDAGGFFYLGKMSRWYQILRVIHERVDIPASVQC
jgi:hypothetical protein